VDHPAAGVQRQHTPAVLANQLLLADRWGQPCRAYNVCTRPGPAAAAALAALQARALRLEPSLLRVPEPALHINLAWLLPVHQEFGRPKDELWQRHGPQWLATLAETAGQTNRFRLAFRHLAATRSAVITVAASCCRCCISPAAEAPATWPTSLCSAMPGRSTTRHHWCDGSQPPSSVSTSRSVNC
jgi:hypothetical protein